MRRILLVDDKQTMVSFLSTVLKRHGFEVVPAYNGQQAIDIFEPDQFDVVISDLRMEPINGIELLKALRAKQDNLLFILITAFAEINAAVEALKHGVFDCLIKPFDVSDLLTTMRRGLIYQHALDGALDLRMLVGSYHLMGDLVAESDSMKQVCRATQQLAPLDMSILIYGEKGTGKSLIARTIHDYSMRRDRPFLELDCAVLHETLTGAGGARADKELLAGLLGGGTLFLDSVEVMQPDVQEELLREVWQLIPVDTDPSVLREMPRIIASTAVDLEELVKEEKFSENLYRVISGTSIMVGSLRERREDILPLVYHIASRETGTTGELPSLDTDACVVLGQHTWPGNVGELERCVRGALETAGDGNITRAALPSSVIDAVGSDAEKIDLKEEFMQAAFLKQFLKGAQTEAAQTIREKAEMYGKQKRKEERQKKKEEREKKKEEEQEEKED
ncbi:sigma-54-dependent transcriptional regulator [Verrucomicrobiota bacterium]